MGPELVLIWTAGVAMLVVIFGSVWHHRLTQELPVDLRLVAHVKRRRNMPSPVERGITVERLPALIMMTVLLLSFVGLAYWFISIWR